MSYYGKMWVTVGEKDTAESLGFGEGLTWETVWSAPENEPLRNSKREGLVLSPGDRLYVPERRQKWMDAPIDQRSRFRRKGIPSRIRIRVEVNEQPEEGVPYVLAIDKHRVEGFVPSSGIIEHWVRPDQEDGILWVGRGSTRRRYALKLRELRPLDTVAGVQNRLCSRGYPVTVTGEMDEETRHRLGLFQSDHGLPVTGEPDDATLAKLKDIHGI